jgi:outer membrane protein assembly factor BamA
MELTCMARVAVFAMLCSGLSAAQTGEAVEPPEREAQSSTKADAPASSRADLWRNAKIAKKNEAQPFRLGVIERLLVAAERGKFDLAPGGITPTIGTVTGGSGPALGARWDGHRMFGSPLDISLSGQVSTRRYQSYGLQLGRLEKQDSTYRLEQIGKRLFTEFNETGGKEPGAVYYLDLNYDRFPQEEFYGIGPDSLVSNRSDYRYHSTTVEGVTGVQLNRWLGWSARAGLVQVAIGPGSDTRYPDTQELFAPSAAPGLTDRLNYVRLATGLLADYRDRPHNAHRGGMVGVLLSHYDDRGDRFAYNRMALETRQYLPLWSDYRTLALRFLTSFDRPVDGSEVPFYVQETLGGSNSLRGFREYRFRDRNLLLMSAEYRWEAAEFIQMVLFYDTGKVFRRTSEFGFSALEKGYGGGIRLKTGNSVFLRLEYGRSREGNAVHLKLGPAF